MQVSDFGGLVLHVQVWEHGQVWEHVQVLESRGVETSRRRFDVEFLNFCVFVVSVRRDVDSTLDFLTFVVLCVCCVETSIRRRIS